MTAVLPWCGRRSALRAAAISGSPGRSIQPARAAIIHDDIAAFRGRLRTAEQYPEWPRIETRKYLDRMAAPEQPAPEARAGG